MRKLSIILLCAGLMATLIDPVMARDAARPGLRFTSDWAESGATDLTDPGLRNLYESAAVDTYCIVWYHFEGNNWQGWTRVDQTAQWGNFVHVDDFAGLGGGSYGRLVPIEGSKSAWCGTRANTTDPYLCSWMRPPGYGNGWTQWLTTRAFSFSGALTLSYHIVWDSEPDYDFTRVEYDAGGDDWRTVAEYTDHGSTAATLFLPLSQASTKLRFHFTSDGAWSDQDGLWNSDGGFIVDSIRVSDSGALYNFENFEGAAVGDHDAGIWHGEPHPGFGFYSGFRNNLTDKDPCGDNFGSQIVFFVGSPFPSASYPGLYDTPFCTGPGGITAPCQDEKLWSPKIDMKRYSTACNEVQDGTIPVGDLPQLGGCRFNFTVYRDLPLPNLVFYQWTVRGFHGGCPGQWLDRSFVYYGPDMDYIQTTNDVSDLVGGMDTLQVGFGVIDMCDVWYLVNGNCGSHTPSPWFDNVRLYSYKTSGPQWSYRDLDLFQDNFPELEYDIESYVRADAANDIFANNNPVIHPGDTIVVDCTSLLGGGIAEDPTYGGPAVYLHVKCTYLGPAPTKPNLYGPTLAGSSVHGTSPPVTVNYRYIGDDGVWTIIQCDTARTQAGEVRDRYCTDLNDQLFTRGYMIEYYFTAKDVAGLESALPRYARSGPPYFEWTCLPTKNSDVLFVDDYTDRGGGWRGGAEQYWMPVFHAVLAPPEDDVDIYDVNGPTSGVSNGPGSRAKTAQLSNQYYTIVWDSGDLNSVTISDGTVNSDKSNDCQMLIDWMSLSEHRVGLWVCGDGVAYDLDHLNSVPALLLLNTWCGVDLVNDSYFDLTGGRLGGGVVIPLITGDADAGVFMHTGVPDKFYAFGGCPIVNKFDVLEKTANGMRALDYPQYHGTNYYAGIAASETNSGGYGVRTMWFGFSYMLVRDDVVAAPEDRFELAKNVFPWFQTGMTNVNVTPAATPKSYNLAQNYPNPFNPSTTIRYDMKSKGLVTLKVYNVAGELVRTLVNGVKDAGAYSLAWDGRNNLGAGVASGIYFYKMETKGFSETKKMVLLR